MLFLAFSSFAKILPPAANHNYYQSPSSNPDHAKDIAIANDVPFPEPLIFQDMDKQSALEINSSIPFTTKLVFPAAPFNLSGSMESKNRAIDCLASAMWYEAGDDEIGQRSVGQVVLNRVRHPAFPNNICGVIFQGTERSTGCQFSYTCDGALLRTPSKSAWDRARVRATSALTGSVYEKVGLSTHYHTNWVHPVWSAKLEKISEVHTHLFFRWAGKWGRLSAYFQVYSGEEPGIPKMARLSLAHRSIIPDEQIELADTDTALPVDQAILFANRLKIPQSYLSPAPVPPTPDNIFYIPLADGGNGSVHAMKALDICGGNSFCKVVGRMETNVATLTKSSPSKASNDSVAFLYVRDRRTGVDRAYWDCGHFSRPNISQCLSAKNRHWIDFNGNLQSAGFFKNGVKI
ncbi:MAG: cell wall hydrolase [Parasphingorhabdus sp.]|uniref:cell wall hydrolase n=1 Tax=Parasphingorhabdus sp. TaxID=2709688 RepID=UPI003001E0B2